jgi:hypothetical protein
MDTASLAAAAATLLATKGGESFAGEVGRASGAVLSQLVSALRARFSGDTSASEALANAETDPAATVPLAEAIRAHLDRDPAFVEELRGLVEGAPATNHTQFIQIAGDVEKQLTFNAPVHVEGDFNV